MPASRPPGRRSVSVWGRSGEPPDALVTWLVTAVAWPSRNSRSEAREVRGRPGPPPPTGEAPAVVREGPVTAPIRYSARRRESVTRGTGRGTASGLDAGPDRPVTCGSALVGALFVALSAARGAVLPGGAGGVRAGTSPGHRRSRARPPSRSRRSGRCAPPGCGARRRTGYGQQEQPGYRGFSADRGRRQAVAGTAPAHRRSGAGGVGRVRARKQQGPGGGHSTCDRMDPCEGTTFSRTTVG